VELLLERGRLYSAAAKRDQAIASFDAAHRLAPENKAVAEARTHEYRLRGINEAVWAGGDYKQAVADLTLVLQENPNDEGGAYSARAAAWFNLEKYAEAIPDYDAAIRLEPLMVDHSYSFRGLAKLYAGDEDGALADLNRAIELRPTFDRWFFNRACYWMRLGRYQSALADLETAAALDKTDVRHWTWITWIYAACADAALRDVNKALESARAGEIGNRGGAEGAQALAAALAAAGRFDEAVQWQKNAIRDLEFEKEFDETNYDKEKAEAERRLELYQSGKPFYFSR
jgi:tetratricopeptide (TPR) repeat protein